MPMDASLTLFDFTPLEVNASKRSDVPMRN